jgi:hypothetical protein
LKKLISKLKKIKDNAGSGLILVIVALGFIGILTGALLTAVGYVYRLKLYDYNARDNFYYVEQAMNEIYAGIGNKTVGCMQVAYNYTVDNMTYYDVKAGSNGAYVTKTNDQANKDFKKKFMQEVYNVFYGSASGSNEFVSSLAACITNDTVVLDDYEWDNGSRVDPFTGTMDYRFIKKKDGRSGITVLMYDKDGNILTGATADDQLKLDKIVIKNIVLSRTAEYNRSPANGTFTQTLSADIVIAKPDFDVNFNSINADFSTLLDYSIIADMGVDINQFSKLSIQGNIYAGADFYNKWYNYYGSAFDPTAANNDRYFAYDFTKDNYGNDVMDGSIIRSTADDAYMTGRTGDVPRPELIKGFSGSYDDAKTNLFNWKGIERHLKYKTDSSGAKISDGEGGYQTEEGDKYTARYFMLPVTNKTFGTLDINGTYEDDIRGAAENGLGNYTYFNSYLTSKGTPIADAKYDGVNEHSKYSGLYINGTEVDLVSNMVIVPGTIAVMNSGSLSMYGIEANKIVNSQVWADNVVLGGYSLINPANPEQVMGSSALFNADLYIKDDLQLDADNSKFTLNGSYYGYGDSTNRDNRNFTPIVDPETYHKATYKKDADGNFIYYTINASGDKVSNVYEYVGDDYSYAGSDGTVNVKRGDFLIVNDSSLLEHGKTKAQLETKVTKVYRELIDDYYIYKYADTTAAQNEKLYQNYPDTRGHYNSSAIVINGEDSTLDLSKADTIFLAGRAYVELSKYTDITSTNVTKYTDAEKTAGVNYNVNMKSYRYDAAVDDYRTGDSISVKPSQQAYMPPAFVGTPEPVEYTLNAGTTDAKRHDYLKCKLAYNITYDNSVFSDYFGYDATNDEIYAPVQQYDTFGKTYYYYDFEVAYDLMKNSIDGAIYDKNHDTDPTNDIYNADDMAEQFIVDYQWACKNDARLVPHLTKIDDQSDASPFSVGNITLPANATGNHVYSSGAISAKDNTNFNIVTAKNASTSELDELLERTSSDPSTVNSQYTSTGSTISAMNLSDSLLKKSNYVKFALANISSGSAKAQLVDYIVGYHNESESDYIESARGVSGNNIDNTNSFTGTYGISGIRGEGAITPINTYLNFFKIDTNKVIVPKGLKSTYEGYYASMTGLSVKEMELGSGSDVYVSAHDITIYPSRDDGKVKGIILAKGDVSFDSTVTSFEGLIVSGGKVFIGDTNNIASIKSNPEAVKAILNELQLVEGAGEREQVVYWTDSDGHYTDESGNILPDGSAPIIKTHVVDGETVPVTEMVNVGDATQKALADEVLNLFKAYEGSSTTAKASDDKSVDVYDLDYTSVMKYDNWVKNVE